MKCPNCNGTEFRALDEEVKMIVYNDDAGEVELIDTFVRNAQRYMWYCLKCGNIIREDELIISDEEVEV